jgi:hypothetical protein
MNRVTLYLLLFLIILLYPGCSGGGNPVSPEKTTGELNDVPIIGLNETGDYFNASGVMGAYELTINPDKMTAELVSKRTSTIGESYIVSGISFFTMIPCSDCLKIVDYTVDGEGNLAFTFSVEHPFPAGNTSLPPSAVNRLDLDVFDLSMLIKPQAGVPQSYPLTGASVYSGVIQNASGYTKELKNVISDNSALPFVPVVDDSISGVSTWNKFAMGVTKEFEVVFKMTAGTPLRYDLYLTMGYGSSAKKPGRLDPKYYNPEFNRKAAWKVEVTPQGKWLDNNNSTPVNVEVKVYDWQLGANIYGTPSDFANAPASDIYAASDVASVSVEIPGMNSSLPSVSPPDGGAGTPSDPMIFTVPVVNQNLLAAGEYQGIVRVLDTRPCLPVTSGRDFIINTPDGIALNNYQMPEYATYQTFNATVSSGLCWVVQDGGAGAEAGYAVTTCSDDSIVVAGIFSGTASIFGGGGSITKTMISNGPGWDIFVAKYSPDGSLLWVTQAGSFPDEDIPRGITTLSDDSTVITGYFRSSITFGAGESNETTLIPSGASDIFIARYNPNGTLAWAKRAGGLGGEDAKGIATLSDNSVVVTGNFTSTSSIFGQGEANQTTLTLAGASDIFIARYNQNGTLAWAKRAGGINGENGEGITSLSDNSLVVTGNFYNSAIFGQGEANQTTLTSAGNYNIFFAKYNQNGTLAWAKQAGGANDDVGEAITSLSDNTTVATGYIVGSGTFGQGEPNQTTIGTAGSVYIFIARYNTNGTLAWAKQAGGLGSNDAFGITTLSNDSTVLTGYISGSATFGPGETNQTILSSVGSYDIFIAQYNTDGTLKWAKRAGGTNNDGGWGIATLSDNSTVSTGYFALTATFGGGESGQTSLVSAGSADIYVARYCY